MLDKRLFTAETQRTQRKYRRILTTETHGLALKKINRLITLRRSERRGKREKIVDS